ncbi:beta-glucosidase BglX [Flavobacterium sp. TP390]|uniref:Periplasmic beta-glucosidase n=1 Tax=Flavobacterium profundi TaxID=1774945 RepID=A0A6I4ISP9_9FLAO|nr:beta-glucosidase BglX [Flavobacterium profundi]MVO09916.1 beta-glucosidase BglX [Flavobacterium profundi]
MKLKYFIPILTLSLFLSCSQKQVTNTKKENTREKFIAELLAKMTLEEKIGQLNLPSAGDFTTGQATNSDIGKKIEEGLVGGLFNIKSVAKIKDVQRVAVEKSRLKIPLLFGMDVIHGYETTFPIPLGTSCTWNMELTQKMAQTAAKEASADGICWTFSPMVDLSRDPRWGRVAEGGGEDPYLGGAIAKAMVKGYQGEDLSDPYTILSCVKHFALYGASEAGRDYNTVDMSRTSMYNYYFKPYQAAIEAGVGSVMASFNEIDGVPATGNKWLMTEVLRNQWNFKGFVVTDYTGVNEMIDHGMGDLTTVSALAINAGIDMDMVGEGFLKTLKKSVEEGKVSISQLDAAVKRILEAKYDLGLFENPYKYCDEDRAKTEIFTKEHRAFAQQVATESFVLLKNENQVLPLQANQKVALVGPLADAKENMPGTWSVATKFENAIALKTSLSEKLGTNLLYAKGCNLDYDLEFEKRVGVFGKAIQRDGRSDQELHQEAMDAAKKADVVVFAIGEAAEMSGECSSRSDITIPKAQKDLLEKLSTLNKPIVLVLFTGRPLAITEESDIANAILNVWFPGTEAGPAITEVLYGEVNPSGKLSMTFPRNLGQVPIYYNHKNTGRPLSPEKTIKGEFEKFKSNYLDVANTPLYPFGFGLSYTTFDYSSVKISNAKLTKGGTINASVKVANTGKYDGKEVVQLYIRDVVGSTTRPVKELKGFQKVFLKKGETKNITFTITEEDLKFYDFDLNFVAEPGQFEVFIGTNSDTQNKMLFELVN